MEPRRPPLSQAALELDREVNARERLTALVKAAQHLLGSLDASSVTREVLALAQRSVPADAYAVWRRAHGVWRIVAASGLGEPFSAIELDGQYSFDRTVVAEDVDTMPMLAERKAAYQAEGIKSIISVPLAIRERSAGSIVFYYRARRRPDDVDVKVAEAVASLAVAAISSAELFEEQQVLRNAADKAAQRAAFLADVSGELNSLEGEKSLQALASLAVPRLADWCAVDLRDEAGTLTRLAVAHVDPAKIQLAAAYSQRYPIHEDGAIAEVLRTGRPVLYERIDDAMLAAGARDAAHLDMLRQLSIQSVMIVPLLANRRVFGALTFVLSSGERYYDADDLAFAMDVGRRASLAFENLRLYELAQQSNRTKDEFLAALSHELRTPLNAIVGWTNVLRIAPDQLAQALPVIHRNALAQAKLIDDLLDTARITTGKLAMDFAEITLWSVVDGAVETTRPAAAMARVQIDLVPAAANDGARRIRGDATRLQQVVCNVLNNAIKFSGPGDVVRVALEIDGRVARIRISDQGAGIAPDSLARIFEPFQQADSSATRRQGLGLGLSITRNILEMHGGSIGAESDGLGRGATFTVTLPLL